MEKGFKLQVCVIFVLFEKCSFHIFEHNVYFVPEKREEIPNLFFGFNFDASLKSTFVDVKSPY